MQNEKPSVGRVWIFSGITRYLARDFLEHFETLLALLPAKNYYSSKKRQTRRTDKLTDGEGNI